MKNQLDRNLYNCNRLKECMQNCNARHDCVGVAHIRHQCYVCSNSTANEGSFVIPEDQPRYLLWKDHLYELPGTTCLHSLMIKL